MLFLNTFISRKNNTFTFYQEDCDRSNTFFIDKLTDINSNGTGRHASSVSEGVTVDTIDFLPDVHGSIWAMIDGTIAGALFYDLEKSKEIGGIWVVLAHVDPAYRQQGIYTELHKHLNSIAKQLDRKRVVTWFSLKNQKMFQIGKSVGYQSTMVIMERKIDE